MRGRKTPYEEKLLKGTLNTTRDKPLVPVNSNDEVAQYLNKTKNLLDNLWIKLEKPDDYSIEQLEKYTKLFILLQKHYFAHREYLPKDNLADESITAKLIRQKQS
jgi:hypothetical protein